jgi:hypothetical protein
LLEVRCCEHCDERAVYIVLACEAPIDAASARGPPA